MFNMHALQKLKVHFKILETCVYQKLNLRASPSMPKNCHSLGPWFVYHLCILFFLRSCIFVSVTFSTMTSLTSIFCSLALNPSICEVIGQSTWDLPSKSLPVRVAKGRCLLKHTGCIFSSCNKLYLDLNLIFGKEKGLFGPKLISWQPQIMICSICSLNHLVLELMTCFFPSPKPLTFFSRNMFFFQMLEG